jgi:hypothetical protein
MATTTLHKPCSEQFLYEQFLYEQFLYEQFLYEQFLYELFLYEQFLYEHFTRMRCKGWIRRPPPPGVVVDGDKGNGDKGK